MGVECGVAVRTCAGGGNNDIEQHCKSISLCILITCKGERSKVIHVQYTQKSV